MSGVVGGPQFFSDLSSPPTPTPSTWLLAPSSSHSPQGSHVKGERKPAWHFFCGLQLFFFNLTICCCCCFFPDWIFIKPICLQTSHHQPFLVALSPGSGGASSLLSGALLLPAALVTTCLWHFCGSGTRVGLVVQGRGLGDGGANALLGACI